MRSLESLRQDYKNFMEKGHGNINKAKHYNNAVRPIILDIPLDMVKSMVRLVILTYAGFQICLPGLHMSLGIYDRLWELLEGACTELDMLLAKHTSTGGAGGLGNSFDEYVAALRKREQLNEKITTCQQRASVLDQLVTCLSLHTPNAAQNPHLKVLREAASKAHLEVDAVVN